MKKEDVKELLELYEKKEKIEGILLIVDTGRSNRIEFVSASGYYNKIKLQTDLQKTISALCYDYYQEKLIRIEREIASYKIITCSINRRE